MEKTAMQFLKPEDFDTIVNGKKVGLYKLKNFGGAVAEISNFGARLLSLWVPDTEGNFDDVVLGPATIEQAMNPELQYIGTIIGRCANRIRNAQFTLDGKNHKLTSNAGNNHLHGGTKGFDSVVWEVLQHEQNKLQLQYISPDGEEGYPGTLKVCLVFELTEDNALKIESFATTDAPTLVNLTHHAYFNLKGAGMGTIDDHQLQVNATYYTPMDIDCIPIGTLETVHGTPFDFTQMTKIGERISETHEQLVIGDGYDHNFVLNNHTGEIQHAATVHEPLTGRTIQLYTNEPGVQLYTANHLDGSQKGKNGHLYGKRAGFCLETQHFPNSANQPNFPSIRLDPGQTYHSICCYQFLTEQ
ncbi:galactose mutarotase [Muricauda sp. SCSIO 64092]|uniref:aldose epimerase family protein n=1 Tax=Allomuricauda sp. SCSIO 64092 TaxID=2908842 RepID=UPI001FF5F30F|nr:aldose epimerase family protein [Muricauda sp. SCSIO 64092]UOY04952.1 galactose mutarotase [Muricauda sp. SCSIO 64092]